MNHHLEMARTTGSGGTHAFQHRPGTAKVRPKESLDVRPEGLYRADIRAAPDHQNRVSWGFLNPLVIIRSLD